MVSPYSRSNSYSASDSFSTSSIEDSLSVEEENEFDSEEQNEFIPEPTNNTNHIDFREPWIPPRRDGRMSKKKQFEQEIKENRTWVDNTFNKELIDKLNGSSRSCAFKTLSVSKSMWDSDPTHS